MRAPPPNTPPFVLPTPASSSSLFTSSVSTAPGLGGGTGAAAGAPGIQDGGDTFMTITTRPEFAGHSMEEHRLAFLRHGTELTSAQIFSGAGPSSQPPSLSVSQPANPLLRPPVQTQPQTLFGVATPTHQPTSLFTGATLFGSAPPPQPAPLQTGGFSFGGAPSISTPAAPTTSIFGAPPAAPTTTAPAFSFGAPAAAPANAFAAPQQQQGQGQTPQFSFGGDANCGRDRRGRDGVFVWGAEVLGS
ncbi:hypothetical protein MSAN_01628500 [Mycena sanguinolenta]|uniref:Uncharacterized protein n=1 Tax=Mycena sanguinolenta TaxID=230812 RepID=A0A8H6XZV7_9AGAR|nr:hypothetical protein MSAN_01628500 [Mycena sanguinolenta]